MTPRCVWNSGLEDSQNLFRSRPQHCRGRYLSRLPQMHHLFFSWKRNTWRQSRVSKRVDFVTRFLQAFNFNCMKLNFFSRHVSDSPYLAWHDRLLREGRVGTARRTSGLFLDLAGRFFVAAAVTLWHFWIFIKNSKMLLIISRIAIVKLTAMPCLPAL